MIYAYTLIVVFCTGIKCWGLGLPQPDLATCQMEADRQAGEAGVFLITCVLQDDPHGTMENNHRR